MVLDDDQRDDEGFGMPDARRVRLVEVGTVEVAGQEPLRRCVRAHDAEPPLDTDDLRRRLRRFAQHFDHMLDKMRRRAIRRVPEGCPVEGQAGMVPALKTLQAQAAQKLLVQRPGQALAPDLEVVKTPGSIRLRHGSFVQSASASAKGSSSSVGRSGLPSA